jgi:hypothetical protein
VIPVPRAAAEISGWGSDEVRAIAPLKLKIKIAMMKIESMRGYFFMVISFFILQRTFAGFPIS